MTAELSAVPDPVEADEQLALFENLVIGRSRIRLEAPKEMECRYQGEVAFPQVGDIIVSRQYHIVTHITMGAKRKGVIATEPGTRLALGKALQVPEVELTDWIPADEWKDKA